jgi:WD40 repeat protein
LAAIDLSGDVHVWRVADRREQTRVKIQPSPKWLLFAPDGATLLSDAGKGVAQWSLASGQRIGSFDGHTAGVQAASLSPDSLHLATGSDDNTVRVWRLDSRRPVAKFPCGAGAIWSVAFSPDGSTVAASTFEGPIQLWNVAAGQQAATLRGHISYVASLAFSTDGRTLASSSMDKTIRLCKAPLFEETDRTDGSTR